MFPSKDGRYGIVSWVLNKSQRGLIKMELKELDDEVKQAKEAWNRRKSVPIMTVHPTIDLDFAIKIVQEDPSTFNWNGKKATKEDVPSILSELYKWKSMGFDVVPVCKNIDEKGHCKGHPPGENHEN